MTIFDENMKNIAVDLSDEWQYHDESQTVSVMFHGLENAVCGFFGIDLDDEYPEGWVDSYATIDPAKKIVTELYFKVVLNRPFSGDADRFQGQNEIELNLKITNTVEKEALYQRFEATGKEDFTSFMQEAAQYFHNKNRLWARCELALDMNEDESFEDALDRLNEIVSSINGLDLSIVEAGDNVVLDNKGMEVL